MLSLSTNLADIGESVTFDGTDSDIGSGTNLSYSIDFGDGYSDSSHLEGLFHHSYSKYGMYTVSLTVSNSVGSSTVSEQIKIGPTIPLAYLSVSVDGDRYFGNSYDEDIIAGVTTVEFSAEDSFDTDLSDDDLLYQFNFGDGIVSEWKESPTSTHVYDTKGLFSAYVVVKNETGVLSDASDSVDIKVISSLRPYISVNNDRFKETPATVIFDVSNCKDLDNDNHIVSFSINFGDGTPVITNESLSKVKHVYNRDGEFYVALSITNNEGESATVETVIKIGSAFFWEMISTGALWFGILGAVLGFLYGMMEVYDGIETIIAAIMGAIIGAIVGAILAWIWYVIEWWTLAIIGGLIFLFLILMQDSGGYASGKGWFGDYEGHSRAAKKGWRNRR